MVKYDKYTITKQCDMSLRVQQYSLAKPMTDKQKAYEIHQ